MTDTDERLLSKSFDDLKVNIILYVPETDEIISIISRKKRLFDCIRAAVDGEEQEFEWQIKRAAGELIWVHACLNNTTFGRSTSVIAKIRDITEYKARERRLHLLSRVVRHNLRNETNVLLVYADRLKSAIENETLEEEVETFLEIAIEIGTLSDSIQQVEEIAEPDAIERSLTDL
ncbi:PAS domain S-box protein [Halobacteria archaeon AArc-m2/3/4]|uniref:PAS domain S-box protein n=1 Tax=Natronoglomus mannanivorans TaxID=2979990 RepID=A0AAP3E444_9EURY|nr:PAS domain S-box protein [Halobacteria archaeon AArc-xg1-1]MCU4975845.1 PAS domain S-box protein [Halobacteria archaeon AArc-m2/3/4]